MNDLVKRLRGRRVSASLRNDRSGALEMREIQDPLALEAADLIERQQARIEELERAHAEIREVWAGAECGEPVHAQEAYAIRLCKQMYSTACAAIAGVKP